MDGEWQQRNGNVHDELDLTIPSDDKDSFWNNLAPVDDDTDADDEDYTAESSSNRKRGRANKQGKRHRREQIQQLEAVFRECPNPDDHMRLDLAKKLGMSALQVKFWFQNRRSAKKNQLEKQETKMLKQVNEGLKADYQAMKETLQNKTCPKCGGPMVPREENPEIQRLILENAKLKDEIFHNNSLIKSKISGKSPMPMASGHSQLAADLDLNLIPDNSLMMDPAVPPPPHHVLMDTRMQGCVGGSCVPNTRASTQRAALLERVLSAREEFMVMVKEDKTVWLPTLDGEVLDYQRYHDVTFPGMFGLCLRGFAMNGTRDTTMVMATGTDIVSILTDTTRLCEAFPGIVGNGTAKNIAPPTADHGLVQLMNVNLMVLSPRMPTCKVMFARQSQQIEPNVWAVVDVSVNDICGQDVTSGTDTWINAGVPMACRLLPSGCLIEDMNNGYCKVTWIVNAEYDSTAAPVLYHPLLRAGHALGARRWLTSLKRRCQYLALLRSDTATYVGKSTGPIPPGGRNRVLELSQQMTTDFCATICGAGPRGQAWGSVEENRHTISVGTKSFRMNMRVATQKTAANARGVPAGLIISAATTVWLPDTPAKRVFDYICDNKRRGEWDTFSNGEPVQQEDHVGFVQFPRYAVSILRPKLAAHGTNNKKLLLQQTCADDSCMLLAYVPVEEQFLQGVMHGGNPTVMSLPYGFVILPDGHADEHIPPVDTKRPSSSSSTGHRTNDGCLVTALFQTFLTETITEDLVRQTVDDGRDMLSRSILKIKDAVHASGVVTA